MVRMVMCCAGVGTICEIRSGDSSDGYVSIDNSRDWYVIVV